MDCEYVLTPHVVVRIPCEFSPPHRLSRLFFLFFLIFFPDCVGFRNYKFFLLVLIYAVLSMIFMIASMLPRFVNVFAPILDMNYFLRRDLLIAITFVTASLLCLVLSAFLTFHLYLVCNAMSTIEYREKKNHGDADVNHRWAVAHIKYDKGSAYANMKHIMGEPYMWPFPVDPRPEDDGTYTMPDLDPHQEKSL